MAKFIINLKALYGGPNRNVVVYARDYFSAENLAYRKFSRVYPRRGGGFFSRFRIRIPRRFFRRVRF